MKRVIGMAVGLLASLALAGVSAGAGPDLEVLDTVEITTDTVNNVVLCGGQCFSFNPEQPGNWGTEFGHGAVTAFPGFDDVGYVTLNAARGAAKAVRVRHLDGIADDSFDLFVKDVHGAWVKVGHYTDKSSGSQSDSETWVVTEFDLTKGADGKRVNLAEGRAIEIMIQPTALGWFGFSTWGQLAIHKVELLGRAGSRED